MGSKLILLLGLLAGAFLTFTCVNDNKAALTLKYDKATQDDVSLPEPVEPIVAIEPIPEPKPIPQPQLVSEPEPIPEPEPVVQLEKPMFSYSTKEPAKLSAKLSPNDKTQIFEQFILEYCQSDVCTQDLTFDENIEDALWQSDILKIAAFLKEKSVKNGLIFIEGYLLKLEGELEDEKELDALNKLLELNSLEIFKVENLTTIAPKIIIEEVQEEKKQQPTAKQTQDKINQLLKVNPIYFKYNSDNLTLNAQEILNKVITTLKESGETELKVEGHTDSGGDNAYNKALSQKRADSVKKYLLNNGLEKMKIQSTGYGEERPIAKNPRDTINRRVEIHLMRGE